MSELVSLVLFQLTSSSFAIEFNILRTHKLVAESLRGIYRKVEPLSLLTFKGIPKQENTLSNIGISDFTEVDFVISISTNPEYPSITTSK